LAKYIVPSAVTIIKALPLNSNGKVIKSELRRIALK
jgi:acyl-coenzyme A synthetase/AMP-(fatty) acid ligase